MIVQLSGLFILRFVSADFHFRPYHRDSRFRIVWDMGPEAGVTRPNQEKVYNSTCNGFCIPPDEAH